MTDTQTTHEPKPPPSLKGGPRWWTLLIATAVLVIAVGVGVKFAAPIQRAWSSLTADNAPPTAGTHVQFYQSGMHPWIVTTEPGNCPICGMKLEPIDPKKLEAQIAIDPVVVQNIGVRVEPVTSGPLIKTIRTVGVVDYDETAVRDVNVKVAGWIEKLHVDYVGANVQAGQPLFELYSPELYATQEEYLLAWRNQKSVDPLKLPAVAQQNETLLTAALVKLHFFDISDAQIEALQKRGQPTKTLSIRSPHTGIVMDKNANEGMRVDPGMRVFRIADLSRVWVLVTLYESDLLFVSEGQEAVMTLSYLPGQTFTGKVKYVYPYLNEKARQVKVRLEFANADGLLKPGMYANVELRSTLANQRTIVPREAVIDSGRRQVAFVSLGNGRFEPRTVRSGFEADGGMIEVIDGLRPGELVVTSGQFLLDSEARLREALAKMVRGEIAVDQTASTQAAKPSELKSLPSAAAAALTGVLDEYFAAGEALSRDTTAAVDASARKVAAGLDQLLRVEFAQDADFWKRHDEAAIARGKALELIGATDIEQARLAYADLSVALSKLVAATGVPPTYGRRVEELHCPMYLEGQGGGTWLQPQGLVRNPFFGSRMLRCFDRRDALPITGAKP